MTFKKNDTLSFNNITIVGYFILIQAFLIFGDIFYKLYLNIDDEKKLYSIMLTHITLLNFAWLTSLFLLFRNKLSYLSLSVLYILALTFADQESFFMGTVHNLFVELNIYPKFLEASNGTGYDVNYAKYLLMFITLLLSIINVVKNKANKEMSVIFILFFSLFFGNVVFNHINKLIVSDIKYESRESIKNVIIFTSKSPTKIFNNLCIEFGLNCVEINIKEEKIPLVENEIANRNIKYIVEAIKENKNAVGGYISSNFNNNSYSGFVSKLEGEKYRIIMKVDDISKKLQKWELWKSISISIYSIFIFTILMFGLSPEYKKTFKDLFKNN